MEATPGRAFYGWQIALLEAGDVDGLMAQYHEDAVVVTFGTTVAGRPAIHRYFERYLARLGSLRLTSTDKFTENDDAIFSEATVESDRGEARVYDVFPFAGVITPTPR